MFPILNMVSGIFSKTVKSIKVHDDVFQETILFSHKELVVLQYPWGRVSLGIHGLKRRHKSDITCGHPSHS
jgi:hypothetical protein